jgi:hypothetical protein
MKKVFHPMDIGNININIIFLCDTLLKHTDYFSQVYMPCLKKQFSVVGIFLLILKN